MIAVPPTQPSQSCYQFQAEFLRKISDGLSYLDAEYINIIPLLLPNSIQTQNSSHNCRTTQANKEESYLIQGTSINFNKLSHDCKNKSEYNSFISQYFNG